MVPVPSSVPTFCEIFVTLEGDTSPGSGGTVEIQVDSSAGSSYGSLSRAVNHLRFISPTQGARAPRVKLTAEGDLGEMYSLRVLARPYIPGRMTEAEFVRSPNQGWRPFGLAVDCIVVHATVIPTLEATVAAFLREASQVSAHYVVGRDGKIVQMVEDTERAWHAGVSELQGIKGVNDFSIGIEIVNLNDGIDPYTDAQYKAVASIIRHVRETYEVPDTRIVSHAFVARPAGRKNDPVGFDFKRLLSLAR